MNIALNLVGTSIALDTGNSLDLIAIREADKDSVTRSLKRKDKYLNLRRADDDLSN
jgi:hypothetical protein